MRFLSFVAASCALADVALAGADARHVRKITSPNMERRKRAARSVPRDVSTSNSAAETTYIIPQTAQTDKFKVNGSAIPNVDFDIGETYAGLLPISQDEGAGELYFWFHPSANEQADDEILIWLNGGPGCSSLEGLLQENGKFIWQYGTYKPVENPYNWANLTNIVWIEQPAGTGFSPRGNTPNATNEVEAAEQFLGFWKNFVDTFQLHNRKVFLTGESYAGQYVPYIADAMHNATNTTYFNVDSIMIYDPYITYDVVMNDIPAVPFVDYWAKLFNLNDTFMDHLHEKYESCGYKDFMDLAMTFPPNGTLPTPPDYLGQDDSCRLFNEIYSAAILVNPCWDMYQVATTCPLLWDVLGYPGTIGYQPEGADIYFNRTDVQKVINAPLQEWQECIDGVLDVDNDSPASGLSVLPRVIEKNKRSIIVHAELDFKLILNGTIMAIQNMTWNGAQGFSKPPCDWEDFYVPYHEELNQGSLAGAGNFGKWHTERGLTFSTVVLSGHMVPQYAPSAAYRQLEFLLGRIEDLSVVSDFTTQTGDLGNNATIAMY